MDLKKKIREIIIPNIKVLNYVLILLKLGKDANVRRLNALKNIVNVIKADCNVVCFANARAVLTQQILLKKMILNNEFSYVFTNLFIIIKKAYIFIIFLPLVLQQS